jgi:hypothetical protein
MHPPAHEVFTAPQREQLSANTYRASDSWLRKSESGLWELYTSGEPYERGVKGGVLMKELMREQEQAFSNRLVSLVPNSLYRSALHAFISWFNRDLPAHVSEEQKLEIAGFSEFASEEFNAIGPAYQRMLTYHAAHDIGHALQNLALVGCSSFGTWNPRTNDSSLLIGRNFDFYMGDDFARTKVVHFIRPSTGIPFVTITWPAMTGVVSGMNKAGLTVTLNAAKSPVPSGAYTPISLLAREILQYASTIQQAVAIAGSRKTFVAESLLIGSAADNRAVVIEKSVDTMDVYDPANGKLLCTNHYQSKALAESELNVSFRRESASAYRFARLRELVNAAGQMTPAKAASILRDRNGLQGKKIGNGNEKALNQLICHHSVIFQPVQRRIWVSTTDWQLGKYVCYDLNRIFALDSAPEGEIYEPQLTIPEDSFVHTTAFRNFLEFRKLRRDAVAGKGVWTKEIVSVNPELYLAWQTAGDVARKQGRYVEAASLYREGLKKEIATGWERAAMEKSLSECMKHITTE